MSRPLRLAWTLAAWDEYVQWQATDKAVCNKINSLIKETLRTPFEGRGKPEPLRFDLAGCWSRRITDEHRLVYLVEGEVLTVLQCRYHY